MKADIQSVSKTRSVLDVSVSPEEVAKVRADVTKSFAAQASLPGFRKGHAPAAMVAKAYGDRIAHEAEDRAVREAYEKAVEENGLKVFEIVSIEDRRANEDGSLSFKATVDLVPTFDLPDLGDETDKPVTFHLYAIVEAANTACYATLSTDEKKTHKEHRNINRRVSPSIFIGNIIINTAEMNTNVKYFSQV